LRSAIHDTLFFVELKLGFHSAVGSLEQSLRLCFFFVFLKFHTQKTQEEGGCISAFYTLGIALGKLFMANILF